jgi:hypothetical protein
MTEDYGEMWRDMRQERQHKRERNRENSTRLLKEAGIKFAIKNSGAHMVVEGPFRQMIDFWPGTGLWMVRGSVNKHRGVQKLIQYCKQEKS